MFQKFIEVAGTVFEIARNTYGAVLQMRTNEQGYMKAVLTTGFGGLDKIEYHDHIPIPTPSFQEVLVRVGACGLNNTDIWTREGAYGGSVDENFQSGWRGDQFKFPRIQGADIVGRIAAVGKGVPESRVGERVIVNPTLYRGDSHKSIYHAEFIGSERDGGFAEYVTVPTGNAIAIQSDFSDAELSTFMVSYLTAEHMLNRGGVQRGQTVLVTGASGGVGSALLQLAKRRGAKIIAVVSHGKEAQAQEIGADFIIQRGSRIQDGLDRIGEPHVDVAMDVVGGPQVNELLDVLRPGGKFVIAGAIGGPVTKIDWRMVYLKYIDILGSTLGTMEESTDLVGYIERGEIKPLLYKAYPLQDIVQAQTDFINKKFFGKLVVVAHQ